MADDLLRFRCYQCNKLLGAPARKAGKTISCPNCKADLIVPEPTAEPQLEDAIRALTPNIDEPVRIAPPTKPASSTSPAPSHDPAFSWEKLDTTIFESAVVLTVNDLPAINYDSVPAVETAEFPAVDLRNAAIPKVAASSSPVPPLAPNDPTAFQFDVPDTRTDVLLIPPVKPGEVEGPSVTELPEIAVETPTVSPTGRVNAPSRRGEGNVVLAQSVLVSWSLFVLLALAISFVAGLFVGHFFWKQ